MVDKKLKKDMVIFEGSNSKQTVDKLELIENTKVSLSVTKSCVFADVSFAEPDGTFIQFSQKFNVNETFNSVNMLFKLFNINNTVDYSLNGYQTELGTDMAVYKFGKRLIVKDKASTFEIDPNVEQILTRQKDSVFENSTGERYTAAVFLINSHVTNTEMLGASVIVNANVSCSKIENSLIVGSDLDDDDFCNDYSINTAELGDITSVEIIDSTVVLDVLRDATIEKSCVYFTEVNAKYQATVYDSVLIFSNLIANETIDVSKSSVSYRSFYSLERITIENYRATVKSEGDHDRHFAMLPNIRVLNRFDYEYLNLPSDPDRIFGCYLVACGSYNDVHLYERYTQKLISVKNEDKLIKQTISDFLADVTDGASYYVSNNILSESIRNELINAISSRIKLIRMLCLAKVLEGPILPTR